MKREHEETYTRQCTKFRAKWTRKCVSRPIYQQTPYKDRSQDETHYKVYLFFVINDTLHVQLASSEFLPGNGVF